MTGRMVCLLQPLNAQLDLGADFLTLAVTSNGLSYCRPAANTSTYLEFPAKPRLTPPVGGGILSQIR